MTPNELYKETKEWQRKVALVSYLHNKMFFHSKKRWTIKDTAKYYSISVGAVSENLKLFKSMEMVKECKTRKEALELLRNGH